MMNKRRSYFGLSRHHVCDVLMIGLGDALALLLALWVGRYVAHVVFDGPLGLRYSLVMIPVWWVGAALAGLLPGWGMGEVEELRRTELLLLSIFALGGVAYFFTPQRFGPSRLAYLISLCLATVGVPLVRLVTRKLLARAGIWGCPAVIYGRLSSAAEVIRAFRKKNNTSGYRPQGIFTSDDVPGGAVEGVPVLGTMDDVSHQVPVALVCMETVQGAFNRHFDRTLVAYSKVVVLPMISADFFQFAVPRTIGGMIGLEITSNLLNPVARMAKRAFDLGAVIFTAPVWLPLMAFIALLVRVVDRHPVFFRQQRQRRDGRVFSPFKFQTMIPGAERILETALAEDPALREQWERVRKLNNDPRVTRLGRALRRWSLDELPQLINVIKGEMSLVGPRPLPDYHHADLDEVTRKLRMQVRPGITGLWQVSGRSAAGTAGMDKWDSYYVRNWSIWLDLIIMAKTVRAVYGGEGVS